MQGWGECDSFDADDLGRCELVGFDDLWCVDEVATPVFGMPTNDVRAWLDKLAERVERQVASVGRPLQLFALCPFEVGFATHQAGGAARFHLAHIEPEADGFVCAEGEGVGTCSAIESRRDALARLGCRLDGGWRRVEDDWIRDANDAFLLLERDRKPIGTIGGERTVGELAAPGGA